MQNYNKIKWQGLILIVTGVLLIGKRFISNTIILEKTDYLVIIISIILIIFGTIVIKKKTQ